jgi:5-methylcytosine-specific restriction enzyme subunit McrC
MRHLELTENEAPRPFDLSADEAEALAAAELATVSRAPGSWSWEVAAGRKVGVARMGNLQIVVRPKIPMDRLVFLMGYARQPQFWRAAPVLLDAEADLAEALADSFARRARKALEQGLLHGYVDVSEALPVVRGRIRMGDQLARRPGMLLPLEVSYDELSVNIAENQLLLAATLRLLRMPLLSRDVRRGLQRLRLQLADVTPVLRGQLLPVWHPSRLNARYQPALFLAELILAGDSFEQRVGDMHISGFVFDMWKIYEDFVCIGLREALKRYGGRASFQERTYLEDAQRVEMRPDLLWRSPEGGVVVVDAKYKAEKPNGFPQADLYQLLAYCTVLGVTEGHVVYAKGNEDALVHSVVGTDVTIHCQTLDLSLPPPLLIAQVEGLAEQLARRALRLEADEGRPLSGEQL